MPIRLWPRFARISWQLPLSIAALLLAVVTAFSWVAYREVRQATLDIAGDRLADVARQLATLLEQSVAQRVAETEKVAAHPAVLVLVETPTDDRVVRARAPAETLLQSAEQIAAVEIWDAGRRRLVEASRDGNLPAEARAFPAWAVPDAPAVSGIRSSAGAIWYEVVAPVREQDRTRGYVLQYRRLASSAQAVDLIRNLIGSDARFFIGESQGPWTNLIGVVDAPPPLVRGVEGVVEYVSSDDVTRLGAAAPIPGTGWLVWVEFPTGAVLAGPHAVLGQLVFGALFIVGLGAAGSWALSRRITARLTRVTAAAADISRGEYSSRVPEGRDDELGELARSFNTMSASLQRVLAEREAAHGAFRQSEESFRQLFASNPVPMWVYDADTLHFLEVNDAAVDHYGYTRDEFLRMRITDIRPVDDVTRLLANVAAERPDLSHSGEWRHRLRDGRIIDVDITSHTLVFAGRPAVLVVARDITARKRAEAEIRDLTQGLERLVAERTAELRASEEQFRTLATTAHEAIITADSRGLITYINPGAERAFGYSAPELMGQPVTMLMPEGYRDPHRRGFERFLASGEAHVIGRTVELEGRRKDGAEFPIELSLAAWTREGEPAFAAIIRDITGRREAERARSRQAAALEEAYKELEAFSYSVSHDLRTPLRSMHGFSQALLEDYADRLDAQGTGYLHRILAGAERMGHLIDDLLELARVSRTDLRRQRVDLGAIARRVADDLCHRHPDRAVDVRIADAPADADPRLVGLVLQNLLENAWKFTSRKTRATIEFGTVGGAGADTFFVRDDGAGFDMDYVHQLFGVFQRLHHAREFPGTGVGLAIVQRIVQRHGGRVWAEGAVDRGATFYFTLPAVAETS